MQLEEPRGSGRTERIDAAWPGETPNGLVTLRSARNHDATVAALLSALASRGLHVAALVNHAHNAAAAGLELPPTDLFIFGNPAAGTPLMQDTPSIAIDLPLKMLVATGSDDVCWLTYNDPVWIARRHRLGTGQARAARAMRSLLASIGLEAAGREQEAS